MTYHPSTVSLYLTPEEQEIQQALAVAGYRCKAYNDTIFVPTLVLYDIYQQAYENGMPGGDTRLLSRQQFGQAIRRVFNLEATDRVRRHWNGKSYWGYLHISGPKSEPSCDTPGPRRK